MMTRTLCSLLGPALIALSAQAASFRADSARGGQLYETLACVQCHSVNGTGGKVGPDLGRMVDRGFSSSTLAATMWNHAPGMWAAMRDRPIAGGDLDPQAAQDLMAFFYAARFFEKPGDAGRGKRAFESLGCAGCHGLASSPAPAANAGGKPVSQWAGLSDPIALADAMWNHRAQMQAESAAKGVTLPQLGGQDLADMLVYLRNLPATRQETGTFRIEWSDAGANVFQSAGCAKCHQTVDALAAQVQGKTLTEIAAEMWNHAPRMAAAGAPAVQLMPGQMRDLVSAFWAAKFFQDSGRPAAGAKVFASKSCAVCHNDAASGAPHLPVAGRDFNGATMVSVLWRHGPRMLDQMKSKGIVWPRFDGTQMADLIAYLNSNQSGHP
jgi:cytochrome c2